MIGLFFACLNGRECGKAPEVSLDDSISSLFNFCDFSDMHTNCLQDSQGHRVPFWVG